jgi:hypothetical protein
VTHFVIGDAAALRRRQNPALLFDSGDDAFDRRRKILEACCLAIATGRDNRRFVDQMRAAKTLGFYAALSKGGVG